MQSKNFDLFLSQLKRTNRDLGFFCDFDKIGRNVERIRLHLCVLNALIGAEDLARGVREIWQYNKEAFLVLDILLAVRDGSTTLVYEPTTHEEIYLSDYLHSQEGVLEYLEKSGLQKIFQDRKIHDLQDYVFGIETGLDTNARKNRSGKVMETMVARILDQGGIPYDRELYGSSWEGIASVLGADDKRFDFAIRSKGVIYLVEVNFYNSGGSKPNEVSRAYIELASKINQVEGFRFVWVTDGPGWLSARRQLEEAYYAIPLVYNLTTMADFIHLLKSDSDD